MLNWFLLVNKPLTWTSFDVIWFSRWRLQTKKIWHTWTLDPLATGLMILWIWKWTKFLNFHTADRKTYEADIRFWFTTETYDDEWEKISSGFDWEISKQQLFEALENFKWKIKQIPPRFSAIKVWWQKLCNLARKWQKSVKIPEREVEIFEIKILDFQYPKLSLKITCWSWTYIRSIANDLWENLWCWWYLTWLKRTAIEDLKLEDAIEKDEISEEKIIPLDKILDFEKLFLDDKILERMWFWQKISIEKLKLEKNFLENNKNFLDNEKNFSLDKEKFFRIYNESFEENRDERGFIWIWVLFDGVLKSKVFI